MPLESNLPRWDQGKRIESDDLNALSDAVYQQERQYGDNYLEGDTPPRYTPKIMDHRIGVIRVDGGPGSGSAGEGVAPDFTDARYWLELYVPKINLNPGDRFDVDKDDTSDIGGIVTAVNFPELPSISATFGLPCGGCHLLSPGQVVHATLWRTRGTPSLAFWMFNLNPSPVRVKITDDAGCGVAMYNGVAVKRPTADIDKSVDLSSPGADGPVVIIRNLQEIGSTTGSHWLTDAGNANQVYFSGPLSYVNSDGVAVIDINAIWVNPCSPPPPP